MVCRTSQGHSIHRRRRRHNQSPAWAQHPRSSCHRQCIYGRDDPTSRRHLYHSPHRSRTRKATRMSYLDEEAGRSWDASDTCAWCSDGGRSHRTSCTHEILEDIWSWSSSTSSCWPSWAWQSQESNLLRTRSRNLLRDIGSSARIWLWHLSIFHLL